MTSTLELLQQTYSDIEQLDLAVVAEKYFDLKISSLKKKIKLGEIPKSFCDAITNDKVSIVALAELLDTLQAFNTTEVTATRNISPIAKIMLQSDLTDMFGCVLIPYKVVAEKIFDWKEGTAKARLASGKVSEMGLVTVRTYESTQAPVFVLVNDLANFLLLKRKVLIMNHV